MAPWKRLGDEYHDFESKFYLNNLEKAQNSDRWNWARQAASMKETDGLPAKEVAYMVGIMYEAGSDTTTMALHSFVLAALTYPDMIKDAQKQLDGIVGDSYPTFDDRSRLPIVEAVMKEVLRWRPVSAGGIPHAVTQDDEYMGYRIPAGATVLANHWAIDLDESVYGPDALEFRPSRWLEDPDLALASFGYGRRVCTGQHVAMNSLFINIARLLWAFNIEHAMDENGGKLIPDPLAYSQGFNSGPLPFKARFVARNEQRKNAVLEAWGSTEKDIGILLDQVEVNIR
jgi:cytochrome P450